MARWKLTGPHYLNVPGTVWEYSENDRTTGKPKRIQFPVPTLFDPADPTNWNYKTMGMNNLIADGEIIVAWDTPAAQPQDIIFVGEPTPEMVPLDDEAKEASAKFEDKWRRPPDAQGASFGDALIQSFQDKFKAMEVPAAAKIEGMSEVLAAMTAMMKQNQEIMMMLMGKQMGLQQVVDTEPALPPVEEPRRRA